MHIIALLPRTLIIIICVLIIICDMHRPHLPGVPFSIDIVRLAPSCNSSSRRLKTLRKQAPPAAISHALGQLLDTGGTSALVKWWADHGPVQSVSSQVSQVAVRLQSGCSQLQSGCSHFAVRLQSLCSQVAVTLQSLCRIYRQYFLANRQKIANPGYCRDWTI